MKKIILQTLLLSAFIVIFGVACNNQASNQSTSNTATKDTAMAMNSTDTSAAMADTGAKTAAITPSFAGLDPGAAASIKTIVDDYLQVKNALAADNSSGAATASQALYGALTIDTTSFTAEQRAFYDRQEEDLKENAQHIGKSSDIAHQRMHFSLMSEDLYALVKGFGGGRPLYHDHCPMYNDGKGALWISETADIKNPYLGGKMPDCGTVEEKIK